MIKLIERSFYTLLVLSTYLVSTGQSSLSYVDNYDNAPGVARNQDKLIYAIYAEDEPLKEAYLSYLSYNDSLAVLLRDHFVIYVDDSEYNSVEVLSNDETMLAILELNTEIDTLFSFINRICSNLPLLKEYLKVENRLIEFADPEPSYLELLSYLAFAKDVLQLKKGDALEMLMPKIPSAELNDGRHFDLINFHTDSMDKGYSYLKQYKSLGFVKDSTTFKKIKSTMYSILENTYDLILDFNEEVITYEIVGELGWYINNFESQEWNNRYRYMKSKYGVAEKQKGDKKVLFVNSRLFVQNWILNQVESDAPFMQAEDIGYDLVSVIDLLFKRKIDKDLYPEMESWVTTALKILPGFQSTRAYSEWLKRTGNKKESNIQKDRYKKFRSQLPKDVVKEKENRLKDNLKSHQVLIEFCEDFFYFREDWEL